MKEKEKEISFLNQTKGVAAQEIKTEKKQIQHNDQRYRLLASLYKTGEWQSSKADKQINLRKDSEGKIKAKKQLKW